MIDSDEIEDSDGQESVVLGRLREYGSFVDASETKPSTMPSLQSKLGYQSTTAEKSHLKLFENGFYR